MAKRVHETSQGTFITEVDDRATLPAGARWVNDVEAQRIRNSSTEYPSARILAERRVKQAKAGIDRAVAAGMDRKTAIQNTLLRLDIDASLLTEDLKDVKPDMGANPKDKVTEDD